MELSEIAIAFKNCNADTGRQSFKDYKESLQNKGVDFVSGVIVDDANNYILYDCERLLTKSILNIISADLLNTRGNFHWGFVSAYYSSFFAIQALNRLQLNFSGFDVKCELVNYANRQIKLTKQSDSSGSHDKQYNIFINQSIPEFKKTPAVDRFWNIGLDPFDDLAHYKSEPKLRNAINYYLSINDDFYYELSLNGSEFNKIIRDNHKNPFQNRESCPKPNFSIRSLKISIARLRILIYVLNYIANYNNEYKSYFERNMLQRITPIKNRYSYINAWVMQYFNDWLKFNQIEKEEIIAIK